MATQARKHDINWDDLDKTKFYALGGGIFFGVQTLLYPAFVIKTRLQVQRQGEAAYKGGSDAFVKILKQEGIRGLYRGYWVSNFQLLFRQFYFTAYEFIRQGLGPSSLVYQYLGPTQGELLRNFCAGGGASCASQFFTVPINIIGQRMMVEYNGGPQTRITALNMSKTIFREGGVMGFYRGFGASIIQFAPTSGLWWTLYDQYKTLFFAAVPDGYFGSAHVGLLSATAALGSGMSTVVITNPLDVVRTRLQVEARDGQLTNMRSQFKTIWTQDGIRGFYKGLLPRIVAVAPASMIVMSVYDMIKRWSVKL